jgi:capsular exopolysaccharide synthesis family protein
MTTSLRAERYPDPSWRTDLQADPDPRLISLINPDSFEADQYRTLRYGVERACPTEQCRVLAITSPIAGDGKTVTTINLAGTVAKAGQIRVLLIDADLRRPAVASMLGFKSDDGPGLVDAILRPGWTLEHSICQLERFNLSVVTTRRPEADAYDILASGGMGELIRDARQRYDFVLLDCPPVLPAPDCRLLAQWVDGFLIVVAADKTPRKLLEETLLSLGPTKILGLVFNGEAYRQSRYGKYYYAYYHRG